MTVRTATPADVGAIAGIYDEQVTTGISTFDLVPPGAGVWTAKLASTGPGDHVVVAGDVLGFAYSSSYRPRPAYAATREVSVYVAPGARGTGVGRDLYAELLERLRADGVHTALAVVAQPNPASEALHRSFGFRRVGLLTEVGFKLGRWVDTAILELRL